MNQITKMVLLTLLLASPVALAQTDATSSDSTGGAVVTTTTHDNTGLWGLLGLLGLAGLAGLRRQPTIVTTDRTTNPNVRP